MLVVVLVVVRTLLVMVHVSACIHGAAQSVSYQQDPS
jgi:hypothetical protein